MRDRLHMFAQYLRAIANGFRTGGGVQHAGTIAYFGLLSVVPFLMLVTTIVAQLTEGNPFDDGTTSPVEQTLQAMDSALPGIQQHTGQILERFAEMDTSFSVAGILLLIFAAGAGFDAIQAGVNAMLQTNRSRHFLLVRVVFAGFVIVTASGIFLVHMTRTLFGMWSSVAGLELPHWLSEGGFGFQILMGFLVALSFYILLKILATKRYKRASRWTGAISFAVLIRLARHGLDTYLANVTTLETVYGSAVAFVGLILWLYVAAVVLLLSCCIVRATALWMEGRFQSPPPANSPSPNS